MTTREGLHTYWLRRGRRSTSPPSSPLQVQATQGLPDLESLPLHKYRPASGNRLVDLAYSPPRVDHRESDYVVDPADWTANTRSSSQYPAYDGDDDDNIGAPQGADTIEAILGTDIEGFQCEICDEIGAHCLGPHCVAVYKAFLARQQTRYLEIRSAGAMGKGVFATRRISKDTLLCEYTGRLLPLNPATGPADGAYTYAWHVSRTCLVDAAVYGNIGRFANHHCTQFNCDAVDVMYGRRKVLCYRANQDIAAGEQVFANYGREYFTAAKPCACTASDEPHLMGSHKRVKSLPTKKLCWDAIEKQAADKKRKETNKSRSRSPATRATKLARKR
ncbi:unnamed protein product [Discula destructiva]